VPIEQTLATVDERIAVGDLRAARIRLRSLVEQFPQRLDLRDRLADVYRREHNPPQSGRWSYLREERDAAEDRAFERSFQDDPVQIMAALRWTGHEDDATDDVARARLREVRALAEKAAGQELAWERPVVSRSDSGWDWFSLVVVVVLVVVGAIFAVGVGAIVDAIR